MVVMVRFNSRYSRELYMTDSFVWGILYQSQPCRCHMLSVATEICQIHLHSSGGLSMEIWEFISTDKHANQVS